MIDSDTILNLVTIIISLVALLVSIMSWYVENLAKGKVLIPTIPWFQVRQPCYGHFWFCIPIVMVNTGAKSRLVTDFRCYVHFEGTSKAMPLFWEGTAPLSSYSAEPSKDIVKEGAIPLLLHGQSAVTKLLIFYANPAHYSECISQHPKAIKIEMHIHYFGEKEQKVTLCEQAMGFDLPLPLELQPPNEEGRKPSSVMVSFYTDVCNTDGG